MLRPLIAAIILVTAGSAGLAADGPTISGTVYFRGSPVAGATVWLSTYTNGGETTEPALTDTTGRFNLVAPGPEAARRYSVIARDAGGRIGWLELFRSANINSRAAARIELHEVGEARGRVVDGSGRPVGGAKIEATYLQDPPDDAVGHLSFHIPKSIAAPYSATSGADGSFAVPGIPTGSKLSAEISAPGRGLITYWWSQSRSVEVRLAPAGRIRIQFRGADDPKKLAGLKLNLDRREVSGDTGLYIL